MEHLNVKFGDLAAVVFETSCKKTGRQMAVKTYLCNCHWCG